MKLPLTRPKALIDPRKLPLPLGKALGDTSEQAPKNPYPPLICGAMTANTAQSALVDLCQSHMTKGQTAQSHLSVNKSQTQAINTCQVIATIGFKVLTACQIIKAKGGELIHNDHTATTSVFKLLSDCTIPKLSAVVHYGSGVGVDFNKTLLYHTCQTSSIAPIVQTQSELYYKKAQTQLSAHCHRFSTKQAIIVPCRYYPIAPPPKPKPKQSPCPDKPPSNRLPLALIRKTNVFKPYALPLALACFNQIGIIGKINPNTPSPSPNPSQSSSIQSPSHPSHIHLTTPNLTPTQKGYIMHHTITASLDNIPIHPLSFNIKTDISSFCFSGQIEIGLSDFNAIKDKLHRPSVSANETAVIRVVVGNTAFAFICEEITHNQAFAQNTISLSGRSITAQLSKDYAAATLDNVDLYASQIVAKQLEHLSISAHFGIDDYLIPAGTYTTTGKTPIGVLDDIATACGGFLYSDPNKTQISLLPRYKAPVWQAMSADVILAQDVIKTLSTTAMKQPLYNTVTLVGQSQGGIVYRADLGQDKDAPVSENLLYTEQTNIIKAGIAILSDSGNKHKISLVMPFNDNLAKLGSVWQIGAGGEQAIVQSVTVSVTVSNGVVSSWQTVGLLGHNDG